MSKTPFLTEREFIAYWVAPRDATLKAVGELFPALQLAGGTFPSIRSDATGQTDENLVIKTRDGLPTVATMEYKFAGVKFYADCTVAALAKQPPPFGGERGRGPKGNALKAVIQTYTYMVSGKPVEYGLVSNWEQWVFFRRVVEKADEVLYVSNWYDRSTARLAWAYFVTLAAATAGGPRSERGRSTLSSPSG